jgi:hypothetical protein
VRGNRQASDCASLDPEAAAKVDGELQSQNPLVSWVIRSTIQRALPLL